MAVFRGVVVLALLGLLNGQGFGDDKDKETKKFDDATFVKKAASGNRREVQLGKLAAERASNAEVKSFAERMVKDHQKAQKDLEHAVKSASLSMPHKEKGEHDKDPAKLEKLKGADFDSAYMKCMVEDHETAEALYEKASKEMKNAELKKYATQTLPVVREHLKMAKEISGRLIRKER